MNALSNNTIHRGLFVEAESKFAARLPQPARIAAIVGVLVVANLVFAVSAASGVAMQPDLTVSGFDGQFSALEMDLNVTPRSSAVGLVEIPFDPLLP